VPSMTVSWTDGEYHDLTASVWYDEMTSIKSPIKTSLIPEYETLWYLS